MPIRGQRSLGSPTQDHAETDPWVHHSVYALVMKSRSLHLGLGLSQDWVRAPAGLLRSGGRGIRACGSTSGIPSQSRLRIRDRLHSHSRSRFSVTWTPKQWILFIFTHVYFVTKRTPPPMTCCGRAVNSLSLEQAIKPWGEGFIFHTAFFVYSPAPIVRTRCNAYHRLACPD